jgi:hypothetical protein
MKNYRVCDFHSTRYSHCKSPDPKLDYCIYCQSQEDRKHSKEITKNHVPGKWCKEKNQCSKCCEIRHYSRVLRHIGGTCSKNHKCPICRDIAKGILQSRNFYCEPGYILQIWTALYKLYRGDPYHFFIPRR